MYLVNKTLLINYKTRINVIIKCMIFILKKKYKIQQAAMMLNANQSD